MAAEKKTTTPNIDLVTAEFIEAVQKRGLIGTLLNVEEWMYEASLANKKDDYGIAPGAPIPVKAARYALLTLLQEGRSRVHSSTSHGANLYTTAERRALTQLSQDFELKELLRTQQREAAQTGALVEEH